MPTSVINEKEKHCGMPYQLMFISNLRVAGLSLGNTAEAWLIRRSLLFCAAASGRQQNSPYSRGHTVITHHNVFRYIRMYGSKVTLKPYVEIIVFRVPSLYSNTSANE